MIVPQTEEIPVNSQDGVRQNDHLWLLAAGCFVVLQLWLGMISTSFWLDESGTWWIVKDGPAEAIRRAFSWSGQSPLYYLIAWLSSRAFGLNEIALRIPSVLAMCGAICFVYRIGQRLLDRSGAALAAFLFVCAASFYAIDARPYALAMLCLTASTWMLIRWLDSNRLSDAVFYVLSATLLVYAHVIVSLGLAAGVVCAIVTLRKEPRRLAQLTGFLIAIALLSAPLGTELRTFYAQRSSHTVIGLPSNAEVVAGLIPCSLAGAVILLTWIYMSARSAVTIRVSRQAAILIGVWAVFTPLFLCALGFVTDLRLYVERYCSSALPGQALLAAAIVSSIRKNAVRRFLIVSAALIAVLTQGKPAVTNHGNDDWRGAMAFVKAEAGGAPVLLVSPFAEAADFKALEKPDLRDVLFAPELQYGEPRTAIRLPHVFPFEDVPALERATARLDDQRRFFLLNDKPDTNYQVWLLGRLGGRCKSEITGKRFGYVWIARFTCE